MGQIMLLVLHYIEPLRKPGSYSLSGKVGLTGTMCVWYMVYLTIHVSGIVLKDRNWTKVASP